jgi:hypothetical protein
LSKFNGKLAGRGAASTSDENIELRPEEISSGAEHGDRLEAGPLEEAIGPSHRRRGLLEQSIVWTGRRMP